jgi:hypothetical protein
VLIRVIRAKKRKNKKLSETPCPSVVKKRKQHHKLKTTVKNGKE